MTSRPLRDHPFQPKLFSLGLIDTFLSWKLWIPLSKLCYGCYLLHPIVSFLALANRRELFYIQDITVVCTENISHTTMALHREFLLSIPGMNMRWSGVRTPPCTLLENPHTLLRENKTLHSCMQMHHVLVVNSYLDPPPPLPKSWTPTPCTYALKIMCNVLVLCHI